MDMNIVIATRDQGKWQDCLPAFAEGGAEVKFVESLEACKEVLRTDPPRLYILDLDYDKRALRSALMELLMINAMAHNAACSSLDPEEYEASTEGLGSLTSLPMQPRPDDIRHMLELLSHV